MNSQYNKRNLALLTDFYELTMAGGFFQSNMKNKIVCFDLFFRRVPDNGGMAIFAGLQQFVEYVTTLKFTQNDIDFLRSKNIFSEDFLSYLKSFKFTCDVWSVPEGTPIFPGEPVMTVCGPVIEAQFIETMLLLCVNHQSLIATKANRIVRSAGNHAIIEFGARRAHGCDASLYGARAAYIGGVNATSLALAQQEFDLPCVGTMAHSWVQFFQSEYEAFEIYARCYPDNCVLLVDTYDTLASGVVNAIKVFDNILKPMGCRPAGIRIDSGDITYLSKKARKMLDDAGYHDCKIFASNSLDEYVIKEMISQGACVDVFGVGERLITAKSNPVFGFVYKLTAVKEEDKFIPKIKLSDNVEKITTPGFKSLYRLYDRETKMAIADVVTLHDEFIGDSEPYEIFDPDFTWKRKMLKNFKSINIRKQIFDKGNLVYESPVLREIRKNCENHLKTIWDEVKRFENPHKYYVDLSQTLWETKNMMMKRE